MFGQPLLSRLQIGHSGHEDFMKTVTLHAARVSDGFAWTWHCSDDGRSSVTAFPFYYDCLIDAQLCGYRVLFVRAQGPTAPGGAGYSLS